MSEVESFGFSKVTSAKAITKDAFNNQERKFGDRRRSGTAIVLTAIYVR